MSYLGLYPDLSRVKKVLVVKMRHLGDVLLTTPVFTQLKKHLPNAIIDALIYKDTLPMLEGLGAISHFFLYNQAWKKLSFFGKLKKEFQFYRLIRKQRYDLVINLTEGDRGAIVAWVSGAPVCVGVDPEGSGFKGKKKIYSHLVKTCHQPRHTVEKNLDALRRIGIFPTPEERDLSFQIPQEGIAKIEQQCGRGYVVIHPVSRWLFKCPPAAIIAAVIRELDRRGEKVILSAGPDLQESKRIEEIMRLVPDVLVHSMAGQISLKELGALLHLSKGLICVDSVPLHLASALKTPVVALFGPSCDQNWGPWMHLQSCVIAQNLSCRPCHRDGCGGSKMSDCLYTLSPSDIVNAFDRITHTNRKN